MDTEQETQKLRRCAEELVLVARSDPGAAEQLVQEIESMAGQNPVPLFQAYSQRAQGHLLQIRGSMTEAVQHYRIAFKLFEQCHEEIELARTASTLVGALGPLGEFEEALRLAERARQIFTQAKLHLRAARLDVNVGNLYHRLNRLQDALHCYESAALLLEHSGDNEAAAGVLINRSVILMLLYRFDDALQGFLRARAFSEEHGLSVFVAQSEYNRACLLFLMGDYAQALKLMQVAETEFRKIGDEVHVAHCRRDHAEILLELNLPEHAYELANLAEKGFSSSGLTDDRARALLLLGRCLMRVGRTGEAATQYRKAKNLFIIDGNTIWGSMADLEMAAAFMAQGDAREAQQLAENAGELFRAQNHLPFSALADVLNARFSIARQDPAAALFFLSRCEESLKFQLPTGLRYHLEYLKGRTLELQGRSVEARDCFMVAAESLEFLLTNIRVDQAMVRFLEDKDDVYERLAALAPDAQQAFELADRARTHALTFSSGPRARSQETSGKIRDLRESLRSDYLRMFQPARIDALSLFEKIKTGEHQLMHELLETGFHSAEPSMLSSSSQSLPLSPDEVLLEYFMTDDSVSVFIVGNGVLERTTLPISTSQLQEEVNLTRYGLSWPGGPGREQALGHHLQSLYAALIEPIESRLRRQVIIIPHRFLNHLPFHLLLGPDGYLAENYAVSYAPSASAYTRSSHKESSSRCSSLIIGTEARDLQAISKEVHDVASRLPNCQVSVDKSLQEIRPALETATFIHIASHALFRADDPTWSLINLGADVLTPADMLSLKVNADLITMSACSTGQTFVRGNEIRGFVRAVFQWGVPSLIASLWEVNDRATSMLMGRFYTRLQESPELAENLNRAMLDVKQEFRAPYYWGGFVLIGRRKLGKSWECIKSRPETECTDCPGR